MSVTHSDEDGMETERVDFIDRECLEIPLRVPAKKLEIRSALPSKAKI